MRWEFREIHKAETKNQGRHLELFRDEALSEIVHALIREDIQNRLDQQVDSMTPVRIRYCLNAPDQKLPNQRAKKWFSGFDYHLNSPGSLRELMIDSFSLNSDVSFLTIEDFNTTGLRGDTLQTRDPREEEESGERNDFYWFIRNVGRSNKGGSDRGRWGLGKIVYPASSMIRSFFAYSVRESDRENILMGRSVLGIHLIGETEYDSEGYFGLFEDHEYPAFATPTSDRDLIEEFRRDFHVSRSDDEPGLSIVIPFPDESITFRSLINAVIEHYFWEILGGRLELEFVQGSTKKQLSQNSVRDFVTTWKGFGPDKKADMRRMVDFCRKAENLSLRDDAYFDLQEPKSQGKPNMKRVFREGDLDKAIGLFNEGNLLAFECPVTIKKTASQEGSYFLVYLQRDPELFEKSYTVIRSGLTIIGEKRIREPGIRALLLVEDEKLSEFLGDAENPSHTRWVKSTDHFKKKYYNSGATLSYIQNMTQHLVNILSRVDDARMEDLLQDIFKLEEESDDKNEKEGRKKGRKTARKRKVLVTPKPRYLSISRETKNGGFQIQSAESMVTCPDQIVLRIAYEQITGNPFNDYHPSDFDFTSDKSSPHVELVGCSISQRDCNRLVFNVENEDFCIEVTGFDKKRDLRIDARAVSADEIDEEEGEA